MLLLSSANLLILCVITKDCHGKIRCCFQKWWNGPHKGFVRYAVGITAIALVYATFFSADSLVDWGKAYLELRQQRRQIEIYNREISEMDKQIRMLSTDRDTLEEFARERFRFAAPDDDVYILGE